MGTSKRYAHHYAEAMDNRIADGIMRTGDPKTLDEQQVDLAHQPLTRYPEAQPARAWVEYGDHSIEVDVEVTASTPRAIAIRWPAYDDVVHKAWVWEGAVGPRRTREQIKGRV